ncbi:hypothetical protein [Streptomyces sp. NPDC006999]|uniref:hypothetical protein n=1 Tax=Streptomyces sp. NPDC006999 TaxID=3156909 RepID=UPI0033E57CA6
MSATTRNQVFTAVHTVGGLLPADMLVRISEGRDVPGSKPADYGLPSSRSVRDEAERSWEYLKPLWRDLRKRLPEDTETGVPAGDPTGRAQADWLAPLWQELGFGRLTPVGPAGITADSDAEKKFPVSHRWGHALVHQTAWNAELDKRPAGAGTVPPQSMLQECLNRTEAHLWGVLTNGRQVRLLRDSSALATASYVEFDLESIFDGELFSEFVLLYRLLHASRLESRDGGTQWTCWLEVWRDAALRLGARFLDDIGEGVRLAIKELGTGFLRHPANTALRENFDRHTYHTALLRLVYRLLFVFVAEDRDALHPPSATPEARDRYTKYFSTARLREQSRRRRGTSHADRWEALRLVLTALGDEAGARSSAYPDSAASSTPRRPTSRCAASSSRTSTSWPPYGTSRSSATPRPSAGGPSTTAPSTPRSSAPSMSRCSPSSPSTARPTAPSGWRSARATNARRPGRTTPRARWSTCCSTPRSTR